jgi:hypothetical protein
MINLSDYVNKEVTVSLRDGKIHTGKFYHSIGHYTFMCGYAQILCSYEDGTNYYRNKEFDIISIKVNEPEPTESLDSTTLNNIASVLTPATIKYIESHEKYAEVMMALIIEFLKKNLGDVKGELPFMIFDKMYLTKGRD